MMQIYFRLFSHEQENRAYYYAVKLAEEKIMYLSKMKALIKKNNTNIINETIHYEISKNETIQYNRISTIEFYNPELIKINIKVLWDTMRKEQEQGYYLETYL